MKEAVQRPTTQEFLITLSVPKEAAVGRTEVVTENLELGAAFVVRLQEMVKSKGLEVEVGNVSKPMALPFVTIEATDRVAEMVRRMPEVECVVRDFNLIESLG